MNEEEKLLNKNNILYKPEIGYDREFDTIGYNDYEISDIEEDTINIIESLKEDISNIKAISILLPKEMLKILQHPLSAIESIVGDIGEIKDSSSDITDTIIVISDKNEDENEDVYPTSFFRDEEDPFLIITEEIDKVLKIEEDYKYDLASVIQDYTNKLNSTVNEYLNSILNSTKNIDKKEYNKIIEPYKLSTSKISADFKHLSDLIIRSQITREMKSRLYNKRFNIDSSIAHIRSCKIGVEQRKRYYTANYQSGTDYLDTVSNKILENSRAMYDKKYKENFLNLYKYLNSSVILLDECLKMHINEIQAKIILMKKEGNKLW